MKEKRSIVSVAKGSKAPFFLTETISQQTGYHCSNTMRQKLYDLMKEQSTLLVVKGFSAVRLDGYNFQFSFVASFM